MLRKQGGLIDLYIFISDLIALAAAWFLSRQIYAAIFGRQSVSDTEALLLMLLGYLVVVIFFNTNRGFLRRRGAEEALALMKLSAVYLLILALAIFVIHLQEDVSRVVTLLSIGLFYLLALPLRLLLKKLLRKRASATSNRILVVTGTASEAEELMKETGGGISGYRELAGLVLLNDEGAEEAAGIPVVAPFSGIFDFARNGVVDEVILDAPSLPEDETLRLIREFESMGVVVTVILKTYGGSAEFNMTPAMLGTAPVLTIAKSVQSSEKLAVKRIIDILAGIVGTVVTGILTVFLGPAIWLESHGPIFFKQKRVGRNGRIFNLYKFRSMYPDAEARKAQLMKDNEMKGLMFKMTDDPRITKVGRFIRATSLDEFPQFLNILKGDMSLIGTRPPTLDEFVQYQDHHKRRLSMKPGLTGLWQVSGRNEITDFEEVVRLDCYYIDNWSLSMDLRIFFRTIGAVLRRKGSK